MDRNAKMKDFQIQIAGERISVKPLFDSCRALFTSYLCEGQGEIAIAATAEDILAEREIAIQEAKLEGLPVRDYSDSELETTALLRKLAEALIDRDILLMHGSTVAVDGEAFLFTAKSGTGKSTHTRYWREVFNERAVMVNDDKPLLKLTEAGAFACGTPWNGKHNLSTNVVLPLKAVCILERGEENEIHAISAQEALPMVFQQTHRPKKAGKYMELIDRLAQNVKFYRMHCTVDPAAAQMAYEEMSK